MQTHGETRPNLMSSGCSKELNVQSKLEDEHIHDKCEEV